MFRDLSIVGQADAVPLNTGMLYFRHVRPSADHTVQWILAEWLHRVQAVAKAARICAGCDQALLNEMVNGMVLCEASTAYQPQSYFLHSPLILYTLDPTANPKCDSNRSPNPTPPRLTPNRHRVSRRRARS